MERESDFGLKLRMESSTHGGYEIRPVQGKSNPQKYQKWALDQPITAPDSDATVRQVNELLKPLGKRLAIVPLELKTNTAA
jgi:hypothetical protein